MNTVVKNINRSDVEHAAPREQEYGEEVMCAGWNPQLVLAHESPVARINRHIDLPADLANVDVDTFLKRMYECQG